MVDNHGASIPRNIEMSDESKIQKQELADKELVGNGKKKRTSLYVIFGLLTLIVIAVIIGLILGLQGKSEDNASEIPLHITDHKLRVQIADFLGGNYSPVTFNATWITDTEFIYKDSSDNVVSFNVETKEIRVVIPNKIIERFHTRHYRFSPDNQYVLIRYGEQKLYRHSVLAHFTVYEVATGKTYPVEPPIDKHPRNPAFPELPHILQLAEWSPVGNAIAFVYLNNIFYKQSATSEESIQLTFTGEYKQAPAAVGPVYNGVADWVYEEEVLGDHKALWFSPDATQLAYASFNDSSVYQIKYPWYGRRQAYPDIISIPYPKPGTPNPTVQLYVVNLETQQQLPLKPPVELAYGDHYFTSVTWFKDGLVSVNWLNRTQNLAFLLACEAPEYSCKEIQKFVSETGWIDTNVPTVSDAGESYLMREPAVVGGDRYTHVILHDLATRSATLLTGGNMDVTKILYWDQANNKIYYQGTGVNRPSERHIYVSSITNPSELMCISCKQNNKYSQRCLWNDAKFSVDGTYWVWTCQGPESVPLVRIMNTITNEILLTWEENDELHNKLMQKALPSQMDLMVEVEGGFKAQVRILLPHDFDEKKKYPMIVYTYAGPGSQAVNERWRGTSFSAVMSTAYQVIYTSIDGRGSDYKGINMLHQIYRRLGTVEVQDQIDVTKKLTEKYSFIDSSNVGIWGWSYGGFTTASALAHDKENVFKCGISVAPVTSWMYYDSIYTERYMGLPTRRDNFAGYNNTDLTLLAKKFDGKKFYLIHGNADDNVHYQQSMMLSKALERNDVLFRSQSYPDENHSLGSVRPHLYHSMVQFWRECFNLDSEES